MWLFLRQHKQVWIAVITLFFLILITRFYDLDKVPAGMSWDEAAIGYNGYGIWTVRRDEWLHRLPISFQSFGDFKAPFAIYLNGFFTVLFGLNLWTIRLPFALIGLTTIIGMGALIYLLYSLFLQEKKGDQQPLSITVILSTAIFAFSPWVLFFSRAGFESGMALSWTVWGVTFFLYALQLEKKKQLISILVSVLFFAVAVYTYHSTKIVVPLIGIMLIFPFFSTIKKHFKNFFIGAAFFVLLLSPLIFDSICWSESHCGKGSQRLSQVSILTKPDISIQEKIQTVTFNYLLHFTPSFLISGETTTLRHGDGKWGVLLITEFMTLIAVFFWLVIHTFTGKPINNQNLALSKIALFGFFWIFLGIIPAAIGTEVPHANRALLSYPGYLIVESVGIFLLCQFIFRQNNSSEKKILLYKTTLGMGILFHTLCVITFLHHYFTNYRQDSAAAFSFGYKEAFEVARQQEDSVNKILFTTEYGQPYIYALLFRKTNPIFYHGGSLIKYEFSDRVNEGDLQRENTLIIATPEEIPAELGDELVVAPNGEVRFVIVKSKN